MKFNPENRQKLNSPERQKRLPPQKILNILSPKTGSVIADVGCGIGFLSIPAAKMLGPKGRVIAMDISDVMLGDIEKRIKQENITNIIPKKSREYEFPLDDASVDMAIIVNVLHEVDDKVRFMKEVARILKRSGRIGIVEWDIKDTGYGPPLEERISHDKMMHYLSASGLRFTISHVISDSFVMYLAERP